MKVRFSLPDTKKRMKKNILSIISSQLLPLLLAGVLAVAADKPELQDLRHTVQSTTSEQVVLQLNGSYIPKVFTLKGETPRIIFDFPDMTYGRKIKGSTATDGAIVKRIRVGMHTDAGLKTRVVFDVAALEGVTYTQKFDEKSSALTIEFTSSAKAAALATDAKTEKTVKKTGPEKSPVKAVAQPEPEAPVAPPAEPPAAAAQVKDDIAPPPIEQATAPPPTDTAVEPAKKMSPTPPAVQPPAKESVAAKTSAKPETPPTNDEVKSRPAVTETPTPPAVTTTKPDESKSPPPAPAAPPQTEEPAVAKEAVQTEAAKPGATAKLGSGAQLESIKFDGKSPKGEMVLFKLNDFHPPTIHGVEEGIPRVICDFNNTQLVDSAKSTIKTDGKLIKVIRIAKHKNPDRVRVILDLEPNRSYDLQQVFFKEDNLFVIIVNAIKK